MLAATFPFFYYKKRNRKISEQYNFIAQIKKMRKKQFNIFNPWVGKIPWRRNWLPTPVFLPGKSHGQGSLADYSLWSPKESATTEATEQAQHKGNRSTHMIKKIG